MRTHLLLSHTEKAVACPFCSLAGVSYDELNFHINTAHIEKDYQDTNATVVDSGQKSSNDWIVQSPNSTRTSNVNVKKIDKVSQASPQSQSTGTSFSQGTWTSLKISPSAAATTNGAVKLVREGCFACPMCSLVCKDCFILQEHVELHLQDQAAGAGPEVATSTEVSSTSRGRSGEFARWSVWQF